MNLATHGNDATDDTVTMTAASPQRGYEVHIMTRNPRLKPLKDRMNPAQLDERQKRLETHSTWRQEMARQHAITRGGVNTCAKGIEMVFRDHRVTRRVVYGLAAVDALTGVWVVLRGLGWL